MASHTTSDRWQDLFVNAHDGLRLHVRRFGSANRPGIPVVCLPSLSRTLADFEWAGWRAAPHGV
jgi:hypothetical protein